VRTVDGVRTGVLALTAAGLALTLAVQRHHSVPKVAPGDAVPAVVATDPAPPPTATPARVPVYDAAAVIAAAAPRVDAATVAAPRIEIPPAPPPRPRAEVRRERPPEAPRPPARESTQPAKAERPWELPDVAPLAAASAPVAAAAPTDSAVALPPPARNGGLRGGRYPALDVDFQTIGLERYVRATEAAGGAFFAYLGPRGLGPQVSLTENRLVRTARQTDLAVERPYLVSDPAIQQRLEGIDLPEGASQTAVVMLWPRDLDARAWRAIEEALRDDAIYSDQIAQIDARFGGGAERPEIHILGYTLLGEGGRRRLAQPRRIAVPSS
jgi:hypothetical protein